MLVDDRPLISCHTYLKNRQGRHPFSDKKGTSPVFIAHVFGHLRPSMTRDAERLHSGFSIGRRSRIAAHCRFAIHEIRNEEIAFGLSGAGSRFGLRIVSGSWVCKPRCLITQIFGALKKFRSVRVFCTAYWN
jgi:hypothetical protein